MTTYDSAAYCSGNLGPGNIASHIADIQGSGLVTAILWAVHVGRPSIAGQQYGDLIFNDMPNLFVSAGKFNPNNDPAIAAWPAQVAQLKQQGSVRRVLFSFGGAVPWVEDFTTIQYMLQNGMAGVITENIAALKAAFTFDGVCVIDGFDIDNEEDVDASTIVQFCQILFQQGFTVTFCPFQDPGLWQGYMQTLWDQGMKVSAWNLQCYAGGHWNRSNLAPWIAALAAVVGNEAAPSYLLPGLAVAGAQDTNDGQCPTGNNSICTTFATWSSLGLPGGFLWTYDWIIASPTLCSGQNKLSAYVAAINDGLNNDCG
jgi:hypothetical protein